METSNPALRNKAFRNARSEGLIEERMNLGGTINKSFLLVAIVIVAACWSWANPVEMGSWYMPAIIGGFVLSLVVIFKPTTAPYLAPLYAIAEGIFLGVVSLMFERQYPGIAIQAILCTIGTFLAMLIAYRSGLIRATGKFKKGVIIATCGIALVYVIDLVLSFFGMHVGFLNSGGPLGILVSVVITGVAALNLILDFDMIERYSKMSAPKYMEWYAAFSLLITLVWLYLEMLRLLSKIQER